MARKDITVIYDQNWDRGQIAQEPCPKHVNQTY